jgi:hypothetical protein
MGWYAGLVGVSRCASLHSRAEKLPSPVESCDGRPYPQTPPCAIGLAYADLNSQIAAGYFTSGRQITEADL